MLQHVGALCVRVCAVALTCVSVCVRASTHVCVSHPYARHTHTHARARTHTHTAADSWARWALEWRFLPQRVRTDSGRNGDDTYDRSSTSLTVEDRSKPERDASHLGFEM